jgi:hypothetical protein
MPNSAKNHDVSDPHDICLLLRAHGEHRWMTGELLPVIRQLEEPGAVPEDQLGAALAYLELLWLDGRQRAAETDAASTKLESGDHDRVLYEKARRYHAAVRRERTAFARRVAALTGRITLDGPRCEHAHR